MKKIHNLKRNLAAGIALALFFFAGMPQHSLANVNVRYSVQPIYPENQRQDKVGYFNLEVVPGHRQELGVKVQNLGERTIYVEVSANVAYTNNNGVMEYAPYTHATDMHPAGEQAELFASVAEVKEDLLVIAPGEFEIAYMSIHMPDRSLAGVLVGGFYFVESFEKQAEAEAAEKSSTPGGGTGVVNCMAYAIPVVLREEGAIAEPSFELTEVAMDEKYSDALRITLKNKVARISHLQNLTVEIYHSSDLQTLVETVAKSKIQMAPCAEPTLRLWRDTKESLPAGDYAVVVRFECDKLNYELTWELSI